MFQIRLKTLGHWGTSVPYILAYRSTRVQVEWEKTVVKTAQILKILFVLKMYHWGFTVKINQKTINFDHKICDPRISRIEKILAKNCPKFLDLYGTLAMPGKIFLNHGST